VDRPEAFAGEMGIDLSRCQVCVTEEFLHGPQVGSAFQQMRSVRVSEGVGVQGPSIGQRMTLQDAPGVPRTEAATPLIQEYCAGGRLGGFEHRTPLSEPGGDGVGGGIAERNSPSL